MLFMIASFIDRATIRRGCQIKNQGTAQMIEHGVAID